MATERPIPCFRCRKELIRPDASNADYVTANDTIEVEFRPFLYMKVGDLKVEDVEVGADESAIIIQEIVLDESSIVDIKVESEEDIDDVNKDMNRRIVGFIHKDEPVDVQKTAIVCPECWLPTDFIIWGVHKKVLSEESEEASIEEPEA